MLNSRPRTGIAVSSERGGMDSDLNYHAQSALLKKSGDMNSGVRQDKMETELS